MLPTDETFMREAIAQAQTAGAAGEVPVGAVVVHEGTVVARGANRTITDCDPTAHAELVALRAAATALGNYRLAGTTLYVTLEPCAMCAGAIVQARVERVVYGAADPKAGAVRTHFNIADHPQLNHRAEIVGGVLQEECAALLQSFFASRR